tara:strand:- start:351 stop:1577 length:1227 start_codon:yes stop_codon:yes gene_type:complete
METLYIKPKYDINVKDNFAKIIYNTKEYIFDINDFLLILNYDKNFNFYNINDIYPSFKRHNNNITFLEFLFIFSENNLYFIFKNNNIYDLRRNNVDFFHKYHKNIIEKYPDAIYNIGHYNDNGKDAYIMKNPYWEIENNNNSNKIYLMYCETDTLIKIDNIALEKILQFEKNNNNSKKITFYKHSNGYILSSNINLFIHQIITGCYGNGKGTLNISVDHIDQDPLNNCFNNLRIVDRKTQEQNCKGIKENTKRERKHNAKPLPDGLTQEMMKKYVVYYNECYNKEKNLYREFFKIEKHPKLDKPYIGSKSNAISLKDKLIIVNKIVDDLDNNITNNEEIDKSKKRSLPQYITIQKTRNKSHLVFDRRNEDKERQTMRSILPDVYDDILEEKLKIFAHQIENKYNYKIL